MSKETRLVKNVAVIAIGNICTKCISFFLLPLYTSILTTQEYGTLDIISTFVTLFSAILTLQFEQGLFRYLIEVRQDENKVKKYISTALTSIIVLVLLFVLIMGFILKRVNYFYTSYLILWIINACINSIILQIPRGMGRIEIYALGSFYSGATNVIANVIFIKFCGLGIKGMLFSNIFSLVISTVFIFTKIKLWKIYSLSQVDGHCMEKLIKYSIPLIPNTLCWWIVNVSDRLLINVFIDTMANGIYSVACKFPSLFGMAANVFQLAWTESASENIYDSNREVYFDKIINRAIVFYSSCNISFIALLPVVKNIFIKNEFVSASLYIPILMTGSLFHAIADLYGSIYTAQKITSEIAKTTVLSAVINIVFNYLLIRKLGLYAAAVSTVLAYATITLVRHNDIKKYIKIRISSKYVLSEVLVYIVVFYSYYSNNLPQQVIILALLIPYFVFTNRIILKGVLSKLKKIKISTL